MADSEYEIVITKRLINPEFVAGPRPYYEKEIPMYLGSKELHVTLKEEEFKAVKRACLEVM
jgi:hypothetical protein